MISDDTIERVRESADIVGIIGEYVELKRQGSDYRGPCPFHQGTNRNFSVSAKKAMYYCFVCKESGDVFKFLQRRLGLDWPSAVRAVAERSGVTVVETHSHRDQQEKDTREPIWEVNGAAADYFHRMLWEDDLGAAARAYLEERGVSRELADRVHIGFAPREIGLMRAGLNTLGFDSDRLIDAGLLVVPDEGTEPRPRFRNRLVFPIYDISSRVVGFGGRLLGPGEPKYLNSADSPVFSKGKLLYGLNWAKQAARRDERILVVEGYFDVLRLIGAGVESVVAPMGTALTEDQAKLVRRYTSRVYLLYDSDKAGLTATFRSGDELLAQGASVQVVTLPDKEDPDTFVRTHGAKGLEAQIASSIDVFERKIQLLERGGWFADLRKKRQALDRLLPTLRATTDPLTRDMYLNYAERATGVSAEVLRTEMRSIAQRTARTARFRPLALQEADAPEPEQARPARSQVERNRRVGAGIELTEREFVRILLHRPAELDAVAERIGASDFSNPLLRAIFSAILVHGTDPEALERLLEGDAVELFQELLQESGGLTRSNEVIGGTLASFREKEVREQLQDLQSQMGIANEVEKDELLRSIMRLSKERRAAGSKKFNTGNRSA